MTKIRKYIANLSSYVMTISFKQLEYFFEKRFSSEDSLYLVTITSCNIGNNPASLPSYNFFMVI